MLSILMHIAAYYNNSSDTSKNLRLWAQKSDSITTKQQKLFLQSYENVSLELLYVHGLSSLSLLDLFQ